MALPTVAQWQHKTSRFLRARDNPLVTDIDTLLAEYHAGGKSDVQRQKILVVMLYICTGWLVNKSKNNWRRPYVRDLMDEIATELRTPAMAQAVKDRVGAAGLVMKEDPIELLQPKDLSTKYGLAGGTDFHRVSGHTAKGLVGAFGTRNGVTGYSAKLQNVVPADYVDELRILAAVNAEQFYDVTRNLAYLSKVDRTQRRLTLGDDNLFRLEGESTPYTSLARIADLCVIDRFELIYVSSLKAAGKFHHSSFFSGKPVLFAGELRLENGSVDYINSMSGHYRPSTQDLMTAVRLLRDKYGCDLARVHVEDANANKWKTGDEFLRTQGVPPLKAKGGERRAVVGESV